MFDPAAFIQGYVTGQDTGRQRLANGLQVARDILEAEGVDPDLIDLVEPYMAARQLRMGMTLELTKAAFPIQQLPAGAQQVFYSRPDPQDHIDSPKKEPTE